MSHYSRYLRIAFSAVLAVACLFVVVMGVRSYWTHSVTEVYVTKTHRYKICSALGTLTLCRNQRIFTGFELETRFTESVAASLHTNGLKIHQDSGGPIHAVSIAYWLLTAAMIGIAAARWPRWRFSLRTLLIATTLVALGLGLILW